MGLGQEIVADDRGMITVTGVLEVECQNPRFESSIQGTGDIQGIEFTNTGTFGASIRQSGSLAGEGRGALMTKDGDGIIGARGVGKPLDPWQPAEDTLSHLRLSRRNMQNSTISSTQVPLK